MSEDTIHSDPPSSISMNQTGSIFEIFLPCLILPWETPKDVLSHGGLCPAYCSIWNIQGLGFRFPIFGFLAFPWLAKSVNTDSLYLNHYNHYRKGDIRATSTYLCHSRCCLQVDEKKWERYLHRHIRRVGLGEDWSQQGYNEIHR